MDDKQRMIEVMRAHEGKFTSKYPNYCGSQPCCGVSLACNACDARLNDNADALIAAGFGDVKEKDKRIAVLERALGLCVDHFNCTDIVEKCGKCDFFQDREKCNKERVDDFIRQAEQELAEEKK